MSLDLSDTAKRLIRSLAGKAEDLLFYRVRETGGSINDATGEWTEGTIEQTPIDGAVVNMKRTILNSDLVQDGDVKLIAPADNEIAAGDYLMIYGRKYSIVDVKEINHAGKVQAYIVQARPQ